MSIKAGSVYQRQVAKWVASRKEDVSARDMWHMLPNLEDHRSIELEFPTSSSICDLLLLYLCSLLLNLQDSHQFVLVLMIPPQASMSNTLISVL